MIYLQMKTIKLNLKGILGIITLCMASLLVGVAYADEPIKITISSSMGNVQFDGEWTHGTEWKASSYDNFVYDFDSSAVISTSSERSICVLDSSVWFIIYRAAMAISTIPTPIPAAIALFILILRKCENY